MKTQELRKQIEAVRKEHSEQYKLNEKLIETLDAKELKLKKQLDDLIVKAKDKVKKMFGVIKTEVIFDEEEVRVIMEDSILFRYDSERLEYDLIGLENGMKIKAIYDEVFEKPESKFSRYVSTNLAFPADNLSDWGE